MMTQKEFSERAKKAASIQTIFMPGAWGAVVTAKRIAEYVEKLPGAYNTETIADLVRHTETPCFGFDGAGLVKGILWGWDGAPAKKDGGAIYEANGVRDLSANQLFRLCDDQRYDFLSLKEGDLVWAPNRIGIYIGAHLVVECSASEKAVKARIVQDGGWKMCGQLRRFVSYQTANAAPRGDEYAEFSQGNKARKGSKR